MNSKDVKKELKESLLSSIDVIKDLGDSVSIRCPFCGDSIKNDDSTHFHIKIDQEDDTMPLLFHCFRCDIAGILNSDVLRSVGVFDMNLNVHIKKYNKVSIKNNKQFKSFNKKSIKKVVRIPFPNNQDLAIVKKEYIEKRLGRKFELTELQALKVVFNIADIIRENELDISVSKFLIKNIHENYVGFLSSYNEYIQFRCLYNSKDYRYYNYSIFKQLDNTRNFYAIPNNINLLTTEPVKLVLSEGIFDILGIFYHVHDTTLDNTIYAAVCGCGFRSVLRHYISNGVFGSNVDVLIYSDADKSPWFYKDLYNEFKDWVGSIKLFYNSKSKDCGVPKDKIEIVERAIPKTNKRY